LRKLDFTTQSTKADVYVNLLENIRQQLQAHGQLKPARVFLTNSFGQEERKHLLRLIITHHGQVVQTPAEATHLVFKDDKPASEEEKYGEEYIRTLERGPRSVFVHFWYYPDSYDTWMPLNEVEGEPQEPDVITPPAQWMVTDRWILGTLSVNPVQLFQCVLDSLSDVMSTVSRSSPLKKLILN
jgi:SWI/SNF related-matrix-associated actin-dependent regulator of chromatin subfamily C